jgi:hypothetical protein
METLAVERLRLTAIEWQTSDAKLVDGCALQKRPARAIARAGRPETTGGLSIAGS